MIRLICEAVKLAASPICLGFAAHSYLTPVFAVCGPANIWVSMWMMWVVMAVLHVPPWVRLVERR